VAVIRVRNCDEVVYVPSITYVWKAARPDNPRVGDDIGFYVLTTAVSGLALLSSRKRRCKGKSGVI
jgi:hypothetical protein